jgi:Caspase domain
MSTITKNALVIGINDYPGDLYVKGCAETATKVAAILAEYGDDQTRYETDIQTDIPKKANLTNLIKSFFDNQVDRGLLFFCGHGYDNGDDTYIVAPDFNVNDPGVAMTDIIKWAAKSKIKEKIIILDCCHSGGIGDFSLGNEKFSFISHGLTIIAACARNQSAIIRNYESVFSTLLLGALNGGAADIAGHITPGSIYAYIDRSLGFSSSEQRPVFKSNVSSFISVRKVKPRISMTILKKIAVYFKSKDSKLNLDPSFEFTNKPGSGHKKKKPYAVKKNVAIFKNLQKMFACGLVQPVGAKHMYFAAMNSKSCKLTPLGKHYWELIATNKL